MNLRLRSLHSKEETPKIQVPNSCTLPQLKQIMSQLLLSPSAPSSSLRFSLNRTDELRASSADDSLQSLGVTSGDLVYFSLNPNGFASPTAASSSSGNSRDKPISSRSLNFQEIKDSEMVDTVTETQITEIDKTQELGVDDDCGFYYELLFLKRVLKEEFGDGICSEYNVLVVAVHAVFLESGFVGFDSELGLRNDRLYIMEEGQSKAFTISLCYTLPELLECEDGADSVVLKFQSLGHFVNVYGTLSTGGSEFYWLCLDEYKIAPIINLLHLNYGEKDAWCSKKGVFDFLKIVKDELVLPLLADLCHKTSLVLRCFTSIPADLKLRIFELLPGNDIARMECVCSEVRQTLSSQSDLWKQKFVEEFGVGAGTKGVINWKNRFASYWETRKKRKRDVTPWNSSNRRLRRPRHLPPGMCAQGRRLSMPIILRNDDLQASSEVDSLHSLGVVSGDRFHLSLNPNGFASPIAGSSSSVMDTQIGETVKPQELCSLDAVGNDNRFYNGLCFLKRVLKEELGDNVCSEYNVLVGAVHAVFLQSGLIGFDSELGLRNDRLYIMEEEPSKAFTMSLCYTHPQLLDGEDAADWIVLKFQSIGHFVNVYGTLAHGGSESHRLSFDEYKIAPFINLLRLNCGEKDKWCCLKQFFEFQKNVKDKLVLPLLIDLCHKTGLVL